MQASVVGLATDPNPLQAGRRGALRRADNVVVDLPSTARRRPVFDLHAEKTGTTFSPRSIRRFDGDTWASSYDGSDYRVERVGAVLTGESTPPDPNTSEMQWAEARESLYHTSSLGVRAIESASATANRAAGVDFAAIFNQDGTFDPDGPFDGTGNASWAYRLVGVKKDSNGYIRRSVPSVRSLGTGTGGSAQKIQGGERIYFGGLDAGDIVEGYRTQVVYDPSATPTPAPEHYLAWTYVVQSADVSAGYFLAPSDALSNDDLGAALYTNPGREGLLGGKEPPPIAIALALFAGCMWAGNTTSKHRLELSLLDVGGALSTYRTDTGVQCRRFTGFATNGSKDITGVSSTTGLVVGMALVSSSNSDGPTVAGNGTQADTKIEAIVGTTVTMSKPWTNPGTSVGETWDACDVLEVGSVEFYAWRGSKYGVPTALGSAARCFLVDTSADYSTRIGITAQALYRVLTYYGIANPAWAVRARVIGDADYTNGQAGQLVLEEVGVGGAGFSVRCTTRPHAWSPRLADAVSSSNDRRPGRLWWSDPDEPESVPLLNFVDIGSQVDPIYALTPLNSALLVWKRDGLFRVSGVAPDSWRVDPIDPSLRLMRAECVDVMDGVAYAWTNRGVVAVTESGGVRSISLGLIDETLRIAAGYLAASASTRGAWVTCHRARRIVVVSVPEAQDETTGVRMFAWSSVTEAWSAWTLPSRCAVYDRVDERFYYSPASSTALWEIRVDANASESRGYDRDHTLSGWTPSGSTVTVSTVQAGQWVPAVGHWLRATIADEVHFFRILAVAFTASWVLTIDRPYPSGSTTSRAALEVVVSDIEWQAVSAGSAGAGALWRELQLHTFGQPEPLDRAPDVRLIMGARSDVSAPVRTTVRPTPRSEVLSAPQRAGVSRQVGRAHHLYPSVQLAEAFHAWRIAGLGLVYEPVSEKVRS